MQPEASLIPLSFRAPGITAAVVLGATLGIFILWGALAPINSAAIATGEIIPAGKTKTIQHLEGGIIRTIAVKEGESVTAGQTLIEMDDTEAKAQLAIVASEEASLGALLSRLKAERDGVRLPPLRSVSPSVANQARLFEARREALYKELDGLQRRIVDAQSELVGWENKETYLSAMADSAEEEFKLNHGLYDKGYIARPKLLQLESRKAETAASIAENRAEVARAKQKITDAEVGISKLKTQWLNSVLEDLSKTEEAHNAALEKLAVARDRLARTKVTAPQSGVVNSLRFMTVGGVIPPGGAILDITPSSDQLVVEAQLSPDDIDVVHPGLSAKVRLTAYKTRWHFALNGIVKQVAPDTVKEEKSGRSFYKVRVEIPDSELHSIDRMTLVPGMLAQVEIVTGERSALRYLLDPVIESFHRAMKEA